MIWFDWDSLLVEFDTPGIMVREEVIVEGHYDDTGLWVKDQVSETFKEICGAFVPLTTREINDSGGRYSQYDRRLFTYEDLERKQHVTYRDVTYSLEEDTDFTEYSDVYVYVARAVTPFDSN